MRLKFIVLPTLLVAVWNSSVCLAAFPPSFFRTERVENDCGQVALHVCARYHGLDADHKSICGRLPANGEEVSLVDLAEAAEHFGLKTCILRWRHLPMHLESVPAILPVNLHGERHFVVATRLRNDRFLIIDIPNAGWVDLSRLKGEFDWDGYCLHIARSRWSLFPVYWELCKWDAVQMTLAGVFAVLVIIHLRRNWRKSIRSLSAALTTFCLMTLSMPGCDEAGPANSSRTFSELVSFVPAQITLTSSSADVPVCTELTLRNSSDMPVRVLRLKSSCGCTIVSLPAQQLLPAGEMLSIPIEARAPGFGFKTAQIHAELKAGEMSWKVLTQITLRSMREQRETPQMIAFPRVIDVHRAAQRIPRAEIRIQCYEAVGSKPWIQRLVCSSAVGWISNITDTEQEKGVVIRDYRCRLEVQSADNLIEPGSVIAQAADGRRVADMTLRLRDWEPLLLFPARVLLKPGHAKTVRGVWKDPSLKLRQVHVEALDRRLMAQVTSTDAVGGQFEFVVNCSPVTPEAEEQGSTASATVRIVCEYSDGGASYNHKLPVTVGGDL